MDKKYIIFHGMKSLDDLKAGEKKIEEFLTHLAVNKNVSPSTQNQAMNALVFLYKRVLKNDLDGEINAIRATKKVNVPVFMTREETAGIITMIEGVPQLVVKLMYGSGLRISETTRLRIQDIDYNMKSITVRSGKGAKDRTTPFPSSIIHLIFQHKQIPRDKLLDGQGDNPSISN